MILDDVTNTGGHGIKPIPTIVPTPTEYETATEDGIRTLWVVFVVMVVASILFSLLAWNIPVSRRLYHFLTTIITLTAAASYFAMASGHGHTYHCDTVWEHHEHVPDTSHELCRQVLWPRYVDWAITTPLLLLDLSLLAGIDGAHTLMAVVADLFMVLAGLFAAFGDDRTIQRWGWYAIACIAYLVVVWHVALHGSKAVRAKGQRVTKLFTSLAAFTLIVWTVYPIVWGVADGARKASVDAEIMAYAVLDILSKVVFGFWLLVAHRKLPETNFELGGYWSEGLASEGRIRIEDDEGA